jgi:hypothetical protein
VITAFLGIVLRRAFIDPTFRKTSSRSTEGNFSFCSSEFFISHVVPLVKTALNLFYEYDKTAKSGNMGNCQSCNNIKIIKAVNQKCMRFQVLTDKSTKISVF